MHHQATKPTAVYRIDALLAEGFSVRTIRYYTRAGILPPANGRGRAAFYTDTHLAVLRRIREAQDEKCTLADIAEDDRSIRRALSDLVDDAGSPCSTRPDSRYTIDELIALTGVSRRTIHYYVKRGILPHATTRGQAARYTDHHLAILRRITASRVGRRTLSDLREDCQGAFGHAFRRAA